MTPTPSRSIVATLILCCIATTARAEVKLDAVLPFATDTQVRVRTTISADEAAAVELKGAIVPASGGATLWEGSLGKVQTVNGKPVEAEQLVERLLPKLWTPHTPELYTLTVTAARGGKAVATRTVRFGFRSIKVEDGRLLLNGKPIFLRGIAINPPGRDVPDAVAFSSEFAHAYVRYLRSQNVNLIRMSFAFATEERQQAWFDACDELGMMVDQGNYGSPPWGEGVKKPTGPAADPEEQPDKFTGKDKISSVNLKRMIPTDPKASIAEYRRVFSSYVRHPSVIIYILANELPGPNGSNSLWHEFLTGAYEQLHAWDPTRAYIGNAGYGLGREGEINDVHRYWGWYYNSFLTYYNLRDTTRLFGPSTDKQPFTFSECVGAFTSPLGSFNMIYKKQLASQLCWTGHSPDQAGDALAYQSFIVRHALESFRTMREQNPRVAGLMPFTILFYNWEGIQSFDQMKPKPAMEQMGVSYQPVLLSWELWTPQVYAGTKLRAIAHVVNDAEDFNDLNEAKLLVELKGKDGAVVLSRSVDLPKVPYFGAAPVAVDLELGAALATGDYVLAGRIMIGGKTVGSNSTELFIAAHTGGSAPGSTEVAVFDPKGKTIEALKTLGIKSRIVSDLTKLDGVKQLVIGELALDAPAPQPALVKFVADCGRVLCLAQDAAAFDPSWLPVKIEMLRGTATDPTYPTKDRPTADQQNVNPERPWHPVFAGVDRKRLRLWSDYTNWDQSKPGFPKVYPVTHGFKLTNAADLAHTAILADYDRGLEGTALAEFFDGRGSVILSGLDLIPRIGLDPLADQMLRNLVAYLAAEEHETQPLIEKPILWGDYASERGVLTGPLNGLLYNCRWVAPPTAPDAKPMPDNQGMWNSHPGNPFVTKGVRVIGPFGWSTGDSPRENKLETGEGTFYCRVPAGRRVMVTRLESIGKGEQSLSVSINGGAATKVTVAAGKSVVMETAIPAGAVDLAVRYAGGKQLVILETGFR